MRQPLRWRPICSDWSRQLGLCPSAVQQSEGLYWGQNGTAGKHAPSSRNLHIIVATSTPYPRNMAVPEKTLTTCNTLSGKPAASDARALRCPGSKTTYLGLERREGLYAEHDLCTAALNACRHCTTLQAVESRLGFRVRGPSRLCGRPLQCFYFGWQTVDHCSLRRLPQRLGRPLGRVCD